MSRVEFLSGFGGARRAASPVVVAALVCGLVAALSAPPARADGGAGGFDNEGAPNNFPGGAGGTTSLTGTGGNGQPSANSIGGDGGGGAGATGGNGAGIAGSGGLGGTAPGANGGSGTSFGVPANGGGGGGGGAHGAVVTISTVNSATVSGGNGGAGGESIDAGGGGGGAGGFGTVVNGNGPITYTNMSSGSLTGGNGGAGGGIQAAPNSSGGNGGDGGIGIAFVNGGTLINSGAIAGGAGGAGGASGQPGGVIGTAGTAGAGGAGVVGAGLTINNNGGTITGGLAGDGVTQAFAIVFTGGTNALGSTGTINGGINVQGGSFAPALSTSAIGTPLSFNGPLTFASGTQYVIRVSPTASDSATASGAATLTGATVSAQFTSGFPSNLSRQYTILTATGGFDSTMFAGLTNTNLPAGFTDSLSNNGTSVFLDLSATLGTLPGAGLNVNQQSVATALNNFFNNGGTLPPGFVNVFSLTGGNLANALTQLDGENATGAEKGAFELMNEFLDLMLDPYVYGRGGFASGGQPLGFAPDQADSLPPDIALAYDTVLKAPPKQTFEQRWTAWGSGFGGSATTNGDPVIGSNNVTTGTFGYAAGMDYHFSPDTVLGFSLAGGGTNWNLAQGLGTGRSDAVLAGLYGVTHQGPVYLAGALAFANNWFTTSRTALGDQLTANFQGQSYAARLEGGYRFVLPTAYNAIGVTPYAAIQTQDFRTPAYSETDLTAGGFGLSYAAMNGTDTRSELGGRFDDLTAIAAMPLILRARLAWAHDWVSNPALNAAFESLPGTGFTVNGAPIPQNSALTSAGAELFFTTNWSLIAKFDGEFASGSQTYAGSGTLRYTW